MKIGQGACGERLFIVVLSFEHSTLRKELQTLLSSFEVGLLMNAGSQPFAHAQTTQELSVIVEGEGLRHYASDKGPFLRYATVSAKALRLILNSVWAFRSMINHHRITLALAFRKSLLKIFKDPSRYPGTLFFGS